MKVKIQAWAPIPDVYALDYRVLQRFQMAKLLKELFYFYRKSLLFITSVLFMPFVFSIVKLQCQHKL